MGALQQEGFHALMRSINGCRVASIGIVMMLVGQPVLDAFAQALFGEHSAQRCCIDDRTKPLGRDDPGGGAPGATFHRSDGEAQGVEISLLFLPV